MKNTPNLSLNGFLWQEKDYKSNIKEAIKQRYHLTDLISKIIAQRYSHLESLEIFLKPMLITSMPNPLHLKTMELALDRITKSIMGNEKIAIFGDYDVDGATSSALLFNYLRDIGINSEFHIPDRIKEGYGPNETALQNFKNKNIDLCLLLDCGTSAHVPLKFAQNIGLDIIIIDHHLSTEILPEAIALINPNRFDQESSCGNLAAVGVVFLLITALNSHLEKLNYFKDRVKPDLMNYLDLVAFGTVCDVVTLTGLNRAFVKRGLEIFNSSKNLGIRTLLQVLKLHSKIDTYHLGYICGPRINAGGRIGDASLGVRLLTTSNASEAYEIARHLDDLNTQRKVIEDEALKEAIVKAHSVEPRSVIMVHGKWHPGVNGLIASRLKDIYNLPAIAISFYEDDQIGKASCRSIPIIDMGSSMMQAKEKNIILQGGGHRMAAGFAIERHRLADMQNFLEELFSQKLQEIGFHAYREFDTQADLHQLNLGLYSQLKLLHPFGQGNESPKFMIKDVQVINSKIFAMKHISCQIQQNNSPTSRAIKAMSFGNAVKNHGEILLSNPRSIDILGSISLNQWQGIESVEFIIDDIRK